MTPFRGLLRSISRPSGSAGVAAQEHVGSGQLWTVGKFGEVRVEYRRGVKVRRTVARDSRAIGARDIAYCTHETLSCKISNLSLPAFEPVGMRKRRLRGFPCRRMQLFGYRSSELDSGFAAEPKTLKCRGSRTDRLACQRGVKRNHVEHSVP